MQQMSKAQANQVIQQQLVQKLKMLEQEHAAIKQALDVLLKELDPQPKYQNTEIKEVKQEI